MHIDALSISAHKFYGPKGVGVLYLKNRVKLDPLIKGGGQENNHRAGTHNTPGIVGLAKALDKSYTNMEENNKRIKFLRDKLVSRIMNEIPDTIYNGHPVDRLPNNANFCFKYIESEAILLHLDMLGICASSGSACSSGSEDPSHVLAALGITRDISRSSIRFTLGKETTEDEIDFVADKTKTIVSKLREMSPLASFACKANSPSLV
jgi:cysteine desulfurase